ncbi:hypothetical protein I4U23_031340 [Adineta vaga]|nr:hypothetical protein I4U23_031340 [Adineta vaga]
MYRYLYRYKTSQIYKILLFCIVTFYIFWNYPVFKNRIDYHVEFDLFTHRTPSYGLIHRNIYNNDNWAQYRDPATTTYVKHYKQWLRAYKYNKIDSCVKDVMLGMIDGLDNGRAESFLDNARESILVPFGKEFIKTVLSNHRDGNLMETNVSILGHPKDTASLTKIYVQNWASMYPKTPIIIVIASRIYPQKVKDAFVKIVKKYPNVQLIDFPCHPYSRHHALISFGSLFVPTPYTLKMALDVLPTYKEDSSGILSARLKPLMNESVVHLITDEDKSEKNKEHHVSAKHTDLIKYIGEFQNKTSTVFGLTYVYANKEHEPDVISRTMFIEDHAIFSRSEFISLIFDPTVSESEMTAIGFSATLSANIVPLQYPFEELVYDVRTVRKGLPVYEWHYILIRRTSSEILTTTARALSAKFGFLAQPLGYTFFFADQILINARTNFTDISLMSTTTREERERLKIFLSLALMSTAGFTHFHVSQEDAQFCTLYEIYGILSQNDFAEKISTNDFRLWRAKSEPKVEPNQSVDQNLYENWINPALRDLESTSVWQKTLLSNKSNYFYEELETKNYQDFKIPNKNDAWHPYTTDPHWFNMTCPTMIRLVVSTKAQHYEATLSLRTWLKNGVASAIFHRNSDNKLEEEEEYWIWIRYHTTYRYQREQIALEKSGMRTCLITESIVNLDKKPNLTPKLIQSQSCHFKLHNKLQNIAKLLTHKKILSLEILGQDSPLKVPSKLTDMILFQYAPCVATEIYSDMISHFHRLNSLT